jgi:HAD superfamily hydrolase (TIGR01509 family)
VIRAVAFDADDTVWEFTAAMQEGVRRAVAVAERKRTELAGRLVAIELIERFHALHVSYVDGSLPGVRIGELRSRSFADALADLDVDDLDLVEQMTAAYFAHRHGDIGLLDGAAEALADLGERYVLGLVTNGNTDPERGPLVGRFAFRLASDEVGIRKPDPRIFAMAAAAADCHPSELVHVGDHPTVDVAAAQAAGCRGVWLDRGTNTLPPTVVPDAIIGHLGELATVLDRFDAEEADARDAVGVGPRPKPWPADPRLDPDLLGGGDRRNVADRYRYWLEEAIVADLAARAHPFHVAVENWRHDRNIGAVVRNANAFAAAGVHIVGRRRWNRRGAMSTDRYLQVQHHGDINALLGWARGEGLVVIGVDNVDGSVAIEKSVLPERCVLVFGQEGPGLSAEALDACHQVVAITQYGSTRSINAGVASGIAMHAWLRQHAPSG